jgi:MFS transporter, OFA family, oxalate/formate antiporter
MCLSKWIESFIFKHFLRPANNDMLQEKKENRFFYGWIIAGISSLLMVVCFGVQYSFGIFFKPLIAEFGWTRAETSGIFAVYMVTRGFFSILMGIFCDKYGPRRTVAIGGISLGLGLLLTSRANAIWQIYILYSTMGGLGAASFYAPLLSTLSKWFVKKRGLVFGVFTSGIGVGAVIFSPLAEFLISTYNWRTSYIILGVIMLGVTITAAMLVRQSPEEMGLWPNGGKSNSDPDKELGSQSHSKKGFSLKRATRTAPFWVIFMLEMINYIITVTPMVHIVPFATDCGISSMTAASFLAIIGGFSIIGRLVVGAISDRVRARNLIPITFILMAVMLFSLTLSKEPMMFYVFAIIFGFAYGGSVPLIPTITANYFGLGSMGAILGAIMFGGVVGGGLGPLMAGQIYDFTESYNFAFSALGILAIIGAFLPFFLRRFKAHYNPPILSNT